MTWSPVGSVDGIGRRALAALHWPVRWPIGGPSNEEKGLTKPVPVRHRYGDSNPGFRTENPAS